MLALSSDPSTVLFLMLMPPPLTQVLKHEWQNKGLYMNQTVKYVIAQMFGIDISDLR